MNTSRFYACVFLVVGSALVFGGASVSVAEEQEEANATPLEFSGLVDLERDVHFPAPNGEDVFVTAGEYQVEAAEGNLKLIPSDGETLDPLVVQAQATTHEQDVASPEPHSIPGEGKQHAILLLLPDGQAMQATGSYSGIQSRHPHKFKFKKGMFKKMFKGLAKKLPTVKSLFTTPKLGAVTPSGILYIKGVRFGSKKGKVELQVRVPVKKHFYVAKGSSSRDGARKGKKRIQLDVKSWSDKKIKVRIPVMSGIPDHSASIQIMNAKGLGSISRKVRFYASRARVTLRRGENVISKVCSNAGNESDCLGKHAGTMAPFMGPCFYGGPHIKDKTITAWHMNCHGAVDWDKGADKYTIKLKNNWVIEEVKWGKNRSSTSEKVKLPSAKALTKKYKGASLHDYQGSLGSEPWP